VKIRSNSETIVLPMKRKKAVMVMMSCRASNVDEHILELVSGTFVAEGGVEPQAILHQRLAVLRRMFFNYNLGEASKSSS
jgi:hypothetical protein